MSADRYLLLFTGDGIRWNDIDQAGHPGIGGLPGGLLPVVAQSRFRIIRILYIPGPSSTRLEVIRRPLRERFRAGGGLRDDRRWGTRIPQEFRNVPGDSPSRRGL